MSRFNGMGTTSVGQIVAISLAFSLIGAFTAWGEDPTASESEPSPSRAEDAEAKGPEPLSLADARHRAKVMHDVYAATLEVMHHRYFHGDRAVVPARAMEDIFEAIKEQSKVEARWISVNMSPMSVTHKPSTEFEKRAAEEISSGKPHAEVIEEGYYRRAGAIPLTGGCVTCHGGFFRPSTSKPKFAGLVISIPVRDAKLSEE